MLHSLTSQILLLWIRDILVPTVLIGIRGSVPLPNDPAPDPVIFVRDLQNARKQFFFKVFLLTGITFRRSVQVHHFSKMKSPKKVTKQQKSRFFLLFCLMIEGSGSVALINRSGSQRSKNIRSGLKKASYGNFPVGDREGDVLFLVKFRAEYKAGFYSLFIKLFHTEKLIIPCSEYLQISLPRFLQICKKYLITIMNNCRYLSIRWLSPNPIYTELGVTSHAFYAPKKI